jgi:hypothetical protein
MAENNLDFTVASSLCGRAANFSQYRLRSGACPFLLEMMQRGGPLVRQAAAVTFVFAHIPSNNFCCLARLFQPSKQ